MNHYSFRMLLALAISGCTLLGCQQTSDSIIGVDYRWNSVTAPDYEVSGFGIVVGLDGRGDRSPAVKKLLKGYELAVDDYKIAQGDAALVHAEAVVIVDNGMVTASPVKVASLGATGTLAGGRLLRMTLWRDYEGGTGPTLIASGVLLPDSKAGNVAWLMPGKEEISFIKEK